MKGQTECGRGGGSLSICGHPQHNIIRISQKSGRIVPIKCLQSAADAGWIQAQSMAHVGCPIHSAV